jgi:CubicO group peptidase (beta-lactamase class C family)
MPAGGLFSTAADVAKFCQMILNGGALNGRRYLSPAALHEMTSRQNEGLTGSDYGFGWSISKNGFGHGGAFKNEMEIDTKAGSILILMVQQDGPWGTPAGDAIASTLQRLANGLVASQGNTSGVR